MLVSSLITLVVLPTLYVLTDPKRLRIDTR
jgi:predicted RND superfamily exporter protein